MALTDKKTVSELLKSYSLRPSKRLGQNFLIDEKVLNKTIGAADLQSKDTILEIGSGIGTLTAELAKKVHKVIAIEKDPKMCGILRETLAFENIEIINEDVLRFNPKYKIHDTKYKIVANLPYYIASPVIRKFLESENPPEIMVLMLQKEVAQRICAKPPEMSLLTISVQFYAKPEIVSYVSKECFWPQPKVDSAILKISDINPPFGAQDSKIPPRLFFTIVKAGFSHPRKQIQNNLNVILTTNEGLKLDKTIISKWLAKNNIHPARRAETLSLNDWINLSKSFPESEQT
jgi:16S rRNA (adenine1518-N6/adenine1519-N6)-dimethyltransferase